MLNAAPVLLCHHTVITTNIFMPLYYSVLWPLFLISPLFSLSPHNIKRKSKKGYMKSKEMIMLFHWFYFISDICVRT